MTSTRRVLLSFSTWERPTAGLVCIQTAQTRMHDAIREEPEPTIVTLSVETHFRIDSVGYELLHPLASLVAWLYRTWKPLAISRETLQHSLRLQVSS